MYYCTGHVSVAATRRMPEKEGETHDGGAVAPTCMRMAPLGCLGALALLWFTLTTTSHRLKTRDDKTVHRTNNDDVPSSCCSHEAVCPCRVPSGAVEKLISNSATAEWTNLSVPALPATKKNAACAVFTVTRDEGFFLPHWLDYYGRHFDPEDIWILDHVSTDGSTDALYDRSIPAQAQKARIKLLTGDTHFSPHFFLKGTVENFQKRLLQSGYACVVFSEIDEMLVRRPLVLFLPPAQCKYDVTQWTASVKMCHCQVPDPEVYAGGLREYLHGFVADKNRLFVRTDGRELIELDDDPKPLDWNAPILAQRNWWAISELYSKPLISKVPLSYDPGFHLAKPLAPHQDEIIPLDRSIKLVHTKARGCAVFTRLPSGRRHIYSRQPVKKKVCAISPSRRPRTALCASAANAANTTPPRA